MSEVNLKDFHAALSTTFRRYLFTLNFLPDSESELRDAFWTALEEQDVICREPLLSVIPAYRQAQSAASLLDRNTAPRLDRRLGNLPVQAFDPARPLYEHQLSSLERARMAGTLVVATGTGSGKTECFLLRALDDALQNQGPGALPEGRQFPQHSWNKVFNAVFLGASKTKSSKKSNPFRSSGGCGSGFRSRGNGGAVAVMAQFWAGDVMKAGHLVRKCFRIKTAQNVGA